jgi:hypothetical protein
VPALWRCVSCGGNNPEGIEVCLACGARRETAAANSGGDSEGRRERIARLRKEQDGKLQWQYLTLVYKVERDGSIGSSFPGHWLHQVIHPEAQDDLDGELNAWGELGWELVSLMPNSKPSLTREAGETTEWLFIMKRRVEIYD